MIRTPLILSPQNNKQKENSKMPKYVFTDAEPISMELIPPGDYLVEIKEAKFSIDPKSGRDKMELKCLVTMKGGSEGLKSYVWEHITFTPEMAWKMDTLLKCCNVKVVKGQEVDITAGFLIGLRGMVKIANEKYQDKTYNKIKTWYTDKQKYARVVQQPEPEPADTISEEDLPAPNF